MQKCVLLQMFPHTCTIFLPLPPSPSKSNPPPPPIFFFFFLLILLFYSEYMTLYYICSKSTSKKTLHNPLHRLLPNWLLSSVTVNTPLVNR